MNNVTDFYTVFITRINIISKNKAQSVPLNMIPSLQVLSFFFSSCPPISLSFSLCVTRWVSPAGPLLFHSVIKFGLRHDEPEVGGWVEHSISP